MLDNLTALRKDNTGYDLKQLFIGSEGTLGVITGCALALPKAPASVQVAFLGLRSYEDVLRTFAAAKRDLGEVLSAIEFLDAESYELVNAHLDERPPLEPACRSGYIPSTRAISCPPPCTPATPLLSSALMPLSPGTQALHGRRALRQ